MASALRHLATCAARAQGQLAIAVLFYVPCSLLLTWPIAARLFSHLPLGALTDPTVPFFNLWTLAWNADRLLHGYRDYWAASIFYPAHDTFALSEPQGLTGLLFAPLSWLFGRVAAYNLGLLCLLCFNALAGRSLLGVLAASPLAATLGGALFLGLPLVRREIGVLQLCAAWPALLGLAEIARLSIRVRPVPLVRLGLWMVALAWSCIYYALFFGLFVLLAALLWLRPAFLQPRMLAAGAVALLIVGLGVAPLMAAEARAVSGYQRSPSSIRSGSASVTAWLQLPRDTPLARLFPGFTRALNRRTLYPGLVCCGLAVLGMQHLRRRQLWWWRRYTLLGGALGLWLSFGMRLQLGAFHPYVLAERYFPGFEQLRSPYRAALFVQVFIVVLAGLGLDRLVPLAARARLAVARSRAFLPCACALLALLEVTPWRGPTARFPHEALREPWIAWLATQPAGAVAMLPPSAGSQTEHYVDTVVGMLQALEHGHAIVNGYSGFFPPTSQELLHLLRSFPSSESVAELRRHGVRYAVVDSRWQGAREVDKRFRARKLRRVYTAGRRSVYLLLAR